MTSNLLIDWTINGGQHRSLSSMVSAPLSSNHRRRSTANS